jgi:hypothetical protein
MTGSVTEVPPHKAPTAAQRLPKQPIVPTLARLAAPNMLSMLTSTAVLPWRLLWEPGEVNAHV